jgi:Uma2 family endonuclease
MTARSLPPIPTATTRRRSSRPVIYPTSDGKPMAETDLHADYIIYVKEALKTFFAATGRIAYVSGNNFLYWQEGDPKKCVSPDGYVVFEVPQRPRDSYFAWQENGRLPAVVFEFTSGKTRREDLHGKRDLYERTLRVPEYFLFDPTGDFLRPHRLQGFRLDESGTYQPIPLVDDRLHSQQLNLDLVLEGDALRLSDPVRQTFLLTPQEHAARADAEAARAQTEAQRAQTEAQRAQAEAQRAQTAEAELARLRARLTVLEQAAAAPPNQPEDTINTEN